MTLLETARLRLRPLQPDDAVLLPDLVTPAVSALTANWRHPFTPAMAQERVAQVLADNAAGQGFNRLMERHIDDMPMGWLRVTLSAGEMRTGSLGYWLNDAFHGQGYITEALPVFVRAAIEALKLERLEAGAQPENAASIAALMRLGLHFTEARMHFVPARERAELTNFYALTVGNSAFRPSR